MLAYYLDELNRPQIPFKEPLHQAEKIQIPLNHQETSEIINKLCQEDILIRNPNGYCFLVPLFRLWITWNYPPKRLKEILE